jgi:NADPH:quinone reductase-like Zn-dependent oxidoreductase
MPKTYVHTAFGGPETQQFLDLPAPDPAEGQLLIKVRSAGVNPADWKRRSNHSGAEPPITRPRPMGREAAGVVEMLGPGVGGFAVGDDVFGTALSGAWSEYALLGIAQMAHKPPNVSFNDVATLPVAGATAYDGMKQLHPDSGETLLIIGIGGGVGLVAAQIAVAQGVRVVGTASEQKQALVESIGATHVVSGVGVADRVRAASPDGIAAIFDLADGEAMRELGEFVTDGVRLITPVVDRAIAVSEFGGGRIERSRSSATLETLAQLVAGGALRIFVTAALPLDQVGDALALVEAGHATGKVVIEGSYGSESGVQADPGAVVL